jgi:hypothetical protein
MGKRRWNSPSIREIATTIERAAQMVRHARTVYVVAQITHSYDLIRITRKEAVEQIDDARRGNLIPIVESGNIGSTIEDVVYLGCTEFFELISHRRLMAHLAELRS